MFLFPSPGLAVSHLMVSDWYPNTQLSIGAKSLAPEANCVYPDILILSTKRHLCMTPLLTSVLGSSRKPAPVFWNKGTVLTVRALMSQYALCSKVFRTKIWDRSISCSSCFYKKVTHKPSLCKQIYSSSSSSDQSSELPVLLPQLNSFFFIYSSLTFCL